MPWRLAHGLLCLAGLLAFPAMAAGGAVQPNADKDGLAIHGYDPVAYLRLGKPLKGRPQLEAGYGNTRFWFATDSNRALFQKDPKTYMPAYRGWCAYAMAEGELVDVDPENFRIIDGRVHLFYNGFFGGNTLKKWLKDEIRLKTKADTQWKKLDEKKEAGE